MLAVDTLELAGVERDGEHHDLHHAQRRHDQPFQRRTLLRTLRSLVRFGRASGCGL